MTVSNLAQAMYGNPVTSICNVPPNYSRADDGTRRTFVSIIVHSIAAECGRKRAYSHINVWDVLQLLYRFYTAGKCKQQVIYVHDRKISDAVPSRCGNADDACCWTRFRSKQYNAAKCPVTLSRLPHIRRDASRNCICPLSRVLDYYSAP